MVGAPARRCGRPRFAALARVALAVFTHAHLSACGPPRPTDHVDHAAPPIGVLHLPSEVAENFSVDHRITIVWQGQEQSFRAVLEKNGDVLTIVGLATHGGRGFVLRQEGMEVSFESHLPEPLPFPPEHILMTVQRTWLAGLAGAPLPDGEHHAVRDDEEITERWEAGLLLTRAFRRIDDTPEGRFEISYEGGLAPLPTGPTPSRIVVRDAWMGFEIVLDAITRAPL